LTASSVKKAVRGKQLKTQNQMWWIKTRSQNYNKLKIRFTADSLQFHQQKSASRLTQEFIGHLHYSNRSQQLYHSLFTMSLLQVAVYDWLRTHIV